MPMNPHILSPQVQQYLRAHMSEAAAQVALQRSPFPEISSSELAQQVDARQRCRKKLPQWYETEGIYYPQRTSVEQASSELTAAYKASLVSEGLSMIDLTGGMGVDSLFFAKKAESLVYCEKEEGLAQIVRHNASVLGAKNISFCVADGMTYLRSQPADTFDYVYVDPSRRVGQRRVFRLEDCEPDIVSAQGWLLQMAKTNMIKCAPLLDISAALQVLDHVSEIHVISVDNECKELVFVRTRDYTDSPRMVIATLHGENVNVLAFSADIEKEAIAEFGNPEGYLYEPDAALLKSGAFRFISQHYRIRKLHPHTHLYTSSNAIDGFLGKTYRISQVIPYGEFKKNKGPLYAMISARNFPLTVDALRQRHRIREGNDQHLFFCTGNDGRLLVIFASKC